MASYELYKEFKILKPEDLNIFRGFDSWIFRGQSQNWKLTTTFERNVKRLSSGTLLIEKKILEEFQRAGFRYLDFAPKDEEKLLWLALIQHYGGPTRLLDFSESLYIAAYFSVEDLDKEDDAIIWGINGNTLTDSVATHFLDENLSVYYDEKNRNVINEMIGVLDGKKHESFVLRVEPFKRDDRIYAQQGTFLFPHNIGAPFEKNLFNSFKLDVSIQEKTSPETIKGLDYRIMKTKMATYGIIKIIIPADLRSPIKEMLGKMNIDASRLFPDLGGIARSLYRHFKK